MHFGKPSEVEKIFPTFFRNKIIFITLLCTNTVNVSWHYQARKEWLAAGGVQASPMLFCVSWLYL